MENKIWGDYELLGIIGKGAQGVVYKARQPLLDRLVAIKVLPAYHVSDESFVARFTREAQNIARLSHPNIVHVYDMNRHEGTYYYVMEYIEGEDLGKVLKRGDKLTIDRIIEIVKQVASALGAANEHNMAHRDIKPENILLTTKGQVKVADFGLAKITGGGSNVTREGMILGTVNYMSPEQAKGQECDTRSDLYSLGIVMFRMLVGDVPFKGENLQSIIYQHIHEPPPNPLTLNPSIPPPLARVCLKLLEKQPEKRYQNPTDLIRILDALHIHTKGSDAMTTAEISRLLDDQVSPEDATIGAAADTLSLFSKDTKVKARKFNMLALIPVIIVVLIAGLFLVDKAALNSKIYHSLFGAAIVSPSPPGTSGTSSSNPSVSGTIQSNSPVVPATMAKVNFQLTPVGATLDISKDGVPIGVGAVSPEGLVSLSLVSGTYKVLVRCPEYMVREAVITIDKDGVVSPSEDPLLFVLEYTPEKKIEQEFSDRYAELTAPDDFLVFLDKLKIEGSKYPQNKTLSNLTTFTRNRLAEVSKKLLDETNESVNAKLDIITRKEFAKLSGLKFDDERTKLQNSRKYAESEAAGKLLERVMVIEKAIGLFVEAEAEAKMTLEQNNADSLMKAVGLFEIFLDKFGADASFKVLLDESNTKLMALRTRQSSEQLFESWSKRINALCDSIQQKIDAKDFIGARELLASADEALNSKPVIANVPEHLAKMAGELEAKIRTIFPEIVEKGVRNRKDVVWNSIKDFERAINGKDFAAISSLLAEGPNKEKWLAEIRKFAESPYIKSSKFEEQPGKPIEILNDTVNATVAWSIEMVVTGADGTSIDVSEKVLLHLTMTYKGDNWQFSSLSVTTGKE